MKKIIAFVMISAFLMSLFSCDAGDTSSEDAEKSVPTETSTAEDPIEPNYVNKSSAYICTSDDTSCVQLVYYDPSETPEGDGAVVYAPSSKRISFGTDEYAIQLKRSVKSGYTVEKVGVDKTDSRNFTVVFRNENDIKAAKKFFGIGKEINLVNSDKIHKYGNMMTAVIGGTPYTVTDKNIDIIENDGVYLFDNRKEYACIPQTEKDQINIIVMDDIVAYVGEKNERVLFPSVNGYVLSFVGEYAGKVKASFGDDVEIYLFDPLTSPASYVEVNGYRQEVNYFNCTRTAYAGAVVYDGDFQCVSTQTNEWGLEIAFDADGKALSVKEGAKSDSGNTPIPEGGFVLSVGMDSPLYSKLCKTYDGADGKLVKNVTPYSVHRMKLDGRNIPRVGETAIVYDSSYGSTTPKVENGQLELVCNADGYVIAKGDPNGGNEIPENGSVTAFYGMRYDEVRDFYHIGSRFFVSSSDAFLYIFDYPSVKISENKALFEKLKSQYAECAEKLKNIDYDKAESALAKLDTLFEKAENGDASEAKNALAEMTSVLSDLEYSFTESLRVQDRCGWVVTNPKTPEEVEKVVSNAEKLGLNTVIVSAFDGVYAKYPSEIKGVVTGDAYKEFDALGEFVKDCHSHGLKVFVMFACFDAGKVLDGLPEEHYVNQFKNGGKLLMSRSGTYENRYYDDVTYTLDPFDPEVRDFFTSVITEAAEKYDVDGVQLDYIRFPLPNRYGDYPDDFGYNENTLQAFAETTGITVDPHDIGMKSEYWDDWCSFRRDIITSFAVSLGEKLKSIKKNLNYSVTCFADYGDRQNYVFQSPEYLSESGDVDGVYTMIYAENYENELHYAKDIFDRMGNAGHLIAGIGTYVRAANDDLNRQLGISYDIGCDGDAVFGIAYAYSGGYLDVFRKGAFRKKAVRTDEGGATVAAFAEDMKDRVDNVYSRFYPDVDFSSFVSSLDLIGGASESELRSLRDSVSFGNDRLDNDIRNRIDFIISCLDR